MANTLPSARIIALNVVTGPGANAPIPVTKGRPSRDDGGALKERLLALAASNRKLQRTIKQDTAVVDDLKKALDATDVATILLDIDLNIRFFTPATRLVFDLTAGDIGRPLARLSSLGLDEALLGDAKDVLQTFEPIEREVEARSGAWYIRRILPLQTGGEAIEGVAITFADITRRKEVADALERAKSQADAANAAKSRFLAAASHDLRQPLQTLVLLQELLAKAAIGDKALKLVARLGETLDGMAGMLNALLDINQIEAGTVRAEPETFRIDAVLDRVKSELGYQAEAQRIALHVVPCAVSVRSDPRLLEQMVRNLLSNALKYTKRGRVLLGCRRRQGKLSIEIWDTGVGIPADQLEDIFEEYHQLGNAAQDRSLGMGLGLSIVRRLGVLLGHTVTVRSRLGKGSVFTIQVDQSPAGMPPSIDQPGAKGTAHAGAARAGTVLVVEDVTDVRDLLETALAAEGYRVATAGDGAEALKAIETAAFRPSLVISDYNLPNDMDGLELADSLRARLGRSVPVIILTGDISTDTLRAIALHGCEHLNKPASLKELTAAIERLVPPSRDPAAPPAPCAVTAAATPPVVFVVDDDSHVRQAVRSMLEDEGRIVEDFEDAEAFLDAYRPGRKACLLIDANLPGISGIDLLKRLKDAGHPIPAIMITGHSDVPMAVEAMKAGASDFLEKPIRGTELLAGIARALEQAGDSGKLTSWRKDAADHLAGLTRRQRQIMEMVLAGHPSKNIAADLGISRRTVENHRASIMKRTGSRSLPALARLALAAAWTDGGAPAEG
ncbi:MAG: response regulator [Xanthobacteraceae bacterium]|nr:response regulator [Xanthobacteraceae bacterium]